MIPEEIPAEVLQQITAAQAWHYQVLPFRLEAGGILFYGNAVSRDTEEELAFLLGKSVAVETVETDMLLQALGKFYRQEIAGHLKSDKPSAVSSAEFHKNLNLDLLLGEAKSLNASDIHLEPYEHKCRIRFRIDGILVERYVIRAEDYPSLVNKIKIRAGLDIAEKRLPQDGRIFVSDGTHKFDIRVSSLPTLHGEKIVMRLLTGSESRIDLHALGFQQNDLQHFLQGIQRPNGMVLVSGPTGSGKSTTLYAALQLLNNYERNILTIEDPIEYTLEGVNQVQLKEAIGLDFASALRTFLRQDPDIIMVGEVRDVNTANMAIRASLTGHLVLSTIHTNSAWGIVARLLDMGAPPYLVADTLNTAVAQRLVRRLCPNCKTRVPGSQIQFPRQYQPPQKLEWAYEPKGCDQCFFTGYKGRQAVYEVVEIDRELANCIKEIRLDVRDLLQEKGVIPLADNAFQLLAAGQTGFSEIYPILTAHAS